jgi:tRNA pseudouridine55 synthase
MLTEKAYDATVRLGAASSTDDADGELGAHLSTELLTEDDVRSAAGGFVGVLQQVPSAVSAIKVDGKRAYRRVRDGEDVRLAAREVTVHELLVTDVRRAGPWLDVDLSVRCSAGTYVRAVARDLGEALGVGGHLTALRRTAVGPFTTDDAHTLDELSDRFAMLDISEVARRCFPTFQLDAEGARDVAFGRALPVDLGRSDAVVAVFAPDGTFLALYRQDGDTAVPVAVLAG